MSRHHGEMNMAPKIPKYPKIIYVKCVETGKIYKAEKVYRKMTIIKDRHNYIVYIFRGRDLHIYNKEINDKCPFKGSGKIMTFGAGKGDFLCCNYEEDIQEDCYSYFGIMPKTIEDKIRADYKGNMYPDEYNYVKDEFIYSDCNKYYTDLLDDSKYDYGNYNYNYIRVSKNEYEEYLKSRGNNANNNQ